MKYFNRAVVIGTMVATLFSQSAFAANTSFTDIARTNYATAIETLASKSIVSGVGNGLFQPSRDITYAEAIQLITKAFDINLSYMTFIKAPALSDFFDKGEASAWYADALINAGANGLGIDRNIDPDAVMSRASFYALLTQAMEQKYQLPMLRIVPAEVKDESDIEVGLSGALQRALVYGILSLDNGYMHPNELISRGEAANAIASAFEFIDSRRPAVDSLYGILNTEKTSEGTKLTFKLTNPEPTPLLVSFGSGQQYDVLIYDAMGNQVYQWSNGMVFTMMLVDTTIPANDALTYDVTWAGVDNDGKPLPAGDYTVVFESRFYLGETPQIISDTILVTLE